MSVVSVVGRPYRPSPGRFGFPFVLPLSTTPPPDWAQTFEDVDWEARDPRLKPPYHPRLDGDRIWLAGREDFDEFIELLDVVVVVIEEIDRSYEEDIETRRQRQVEATGSVARRHANEDAALAEWAERQPRQTGK